MYSILGTCTAEEEEVKLMAEGVEVDIIDGEGLGALNSGTAGLRRGRPAGTTLA